MKHDDMEQKYRLGLFKPKQACEEDVERGRGFGREGKGCLL